MHTLAAALGWTVCVIVACLGLAILVAIARGRMDLSMLISETNGGASMSRFQLLVFTFVIALGLFYTLIARDNGTFPEIPSGILALLGISGSSYLVSKGIQFSEPAGVEDHMGAVIVKPREAVVPHGKTQLFTAEVRGDAEGAVVWSVVTGRGTIDGQGLYKALPAPPDPSPAPAAPEHVVVKAVSTKSPDQMGFAIVTLV